MASHSMVTGRVRFGYSVGHVFNDLSNAVWLAHTLLFFEYVVGFKSKLGGYLILLGQLVDAVCTPAVGIFSDRYNLIYFSRFGKRKSWYFLGSCVTMCSLPLLYSECPGCQNAPISTKLYYYCFTISVFQMGWAAVATVHLALGTELTYSAKERMLLLALRNIFTTISNLVVHFVALIVLHVGSHFSSTEQVLSKEDLWKFQAVILVVMIGGGVTSLIFFFSVPEGEQHHLGYHSASYPLSSDRDTYHPSTFHKHLVHSEGIMLSPKTVKEILGQWQLWSTCVIYMCTRVYCNIMQSIVPLYIHDSLLMKNTFIALVPLTLYTASFFASLLTGPLNERFGKKITFSYGAVLACIASMWIYLHSDNPQYKTIQIFFVAILLGMANSVMLVTALSIITDIVGLDTANSAFVYGIMTFFDKASCGVAIMLIQTLRPPGVTLYYQTALAFSCGLSAFVAAVTVIAFRIGASTKQDNAGKKSIKCIK